MIDYLTGRWKKVHLPIAATIINFREAISTVLAVFVTHLADSYVGRYQMIVISALSYVTVSPYINKLFLKKFMKKL